VHALELSSGNNMGMHEKCLECSYGQGVASDGEPAICMDDHRNRVGPDGLC